MSGHDVLFVILDSTRKDRVSAYGHGRDTTPVLEWLAKRSTVFENAYTPAPWTLPSHCSMFTGLFPTEHGVTNGFTDRDLRVPSSLPTVTERLAERGYRTGGFSNNPWVGKLSGLHRGFDEFVEWDLEISRSGDAPIHGSRDGLYARMHKLLGYAHRQPLVLLKRRFFTANLIERAGRWVTHSAASGGPTFTFMNLMEAHSPYYPPGEAFRELGLSGPNPVESRILNTNLLAYVLGKRSLPAERRRRVMEYYDASLRYQDGKLGELLSCLKREGAFDDLLLIVAADHGKTLGEYDRSETPPHYLRNVNVNVPLLIKRPGQTSGERIEQPFELTGLYDVMTGDGGVRSGISADGALTEDFLPHSGRSATEVTRWRALSRPDRKYVRSEGGSEYLLCGSDEAETIERDEDAMAAMREALSERVGRLGEPLESEPAGEDDGVDGSVEAQLEDLGYLN